MISDQCLPKGCVPTLLTKMGNFTSDKCAYEENHIVRERAFDKNKKIDGQGGFVFATKYNYNVILGQDFLVAKNIDIRFTDKKFNG